MKQRIRERIEASGDTQPAPPQEPTPHDGQLSRLNIYQRGLTGNVLVVTHQALEEEIPVALSAADSPVDVEPPPSETETAKITINDKQPAGNKVVTIS